MCQCCLVAELSFHLNMSIHCKLLILIVALTVNGRVHTTKIIGGHEAVPHSRPYMVLLERHKQNGEKPLYCDGFLLNEDFVMTAAHCQARSYAVLLGVHDFYKNKEVQRLPVEQAFPNEDYDEKDYRNDIMLLKLSTKAKFTENVKPIALTGKSDGFLPKSCIVSGWGETGNKHMSVVLMEVNVTLSDNELCAKANVYCSEGKTGPSQGDSGGPLVCGNTTACGVVSHGYQPYPGSPILRFYTKISEHRGWINLIIKKAT